MPTVQQIADYWEPRLAEHLPEVETLWREALQMDTEWPFCWSCAADNRQIERCHLRGRAFNGLDTPANLVLLCHSCHRQQPDSDESLAITWLRMRAYLSMNIVDFFGMLPILEQRNAAEVCDIAVSYCRRKYEETNGEIGALGRDVLACGEDQQVRADFAATWRSMQDQIREAKLAWSA